MHQTRKGKQWYSGMKLHIGVESQSAVAHSAVVTPANGHDKHPLAHWLHGPSSGAYMATALMPAKRI